VHALNFGTAQKNVGVWVRALNFGAAWKNVVVRLCALNFGAMWKNVGVRVRALNLALLGVHTHNKVHVVCTHIIMARVVGAVLGECKGVWLVRTQCGYMLSRDSVVNCARRIFVCSGGILNFGMVQRVE
jgi:hypothetical protein